VNSTSGINPQAPPTGTGCVECLAASPTGWWFHLRRCAQCGHIGCCDDSPSQHARAHYEATGHRYVQSFEPGEDWYWDFQTQNYYEAPTLAPPVAASLASLGAFLVGAVGAGRMRVACRGSRLRLRGWTGRRGPTRLPA